MSIVQLIFLKCFVSLFVMGLQGKKHTADSMHDEWLHAWTKSSLENFWPSTQGQEFHILVSTLEWTFPQKTSWDLDTNNLWREVYTPTVWDEVRAHMTKSAAPTDIQNLEEDLAIKWGTTWLEAGNESTNIHYKKGTRKPALITEEKHFSVTYKINEKTNKIQQIIEVQPFPSWPCLQRLCKSAKTLPC